MRGARLLAVPASGDTARLWLLPQRAAWWPDGETLFVADVHLGKAAAFRAAGLAVPGGTTADNLQRLSALVEALGARRLVVLGDWLHARASLTPAVQQAVVAWRARHAALACVLVRGNHDDHAGDPPASWGFTVVSEPWPLGPWQCRHTPPDGLDAAADPGPNPRAQRPVLCGHRHPVCVVQGPGRDQLRLPCFALDGPVLCLPAFGAWTGGHPVPAAPGVQRWAIADDTLWPLEAPVAPWRALEP